MNIYQWIIFVSTLVSSSCVLIYGIIKLVRFIIIKSKANKIAKEKKLQQAQYELYLKLKEIFKDEKKS